MPKRTDLMVERTDAGLDDANPGRNRGYLVEALGLQEVVIQGLIDNITWQEIHRKCLEKLKEDNAGANPHFDKHGRLVDSLSIPVIRAWYLNQPSKFQAAMKQAQSKELMEQVWDFERNAIKSREKLNRILAVFVGDAENLTPESLEKLTWRERRTIIDAAKVLLQIQESGERFMGIGSKAGNRYNQQEAEKDDVVARVRSLLEERSKVPATSQLVDASFTSVEEEVITSENTEDSEDHDDSGKETSSEGS